MRPAVVSCGPRFRDAGFTDLVLVQAGVDADPPDGFFRSASKELLPALRDAAPEAA